MLLSTLPVRSGIYAYIIIKVNIGAAEKHEGVIITFCLKRFCPKALTGND